MLPGQLDTVEEYAEIPLKCIEGYGTGKTASQRRKLHVMHPSIKALGLVAILLGSHRALAQPDPTSPPPYCKASTLTGDEFMLMIQKIIAHGDLNDVSFVQKTLGTKLRLTNGYGGAPIPNSSYIAYESEEVRGNPIHVRLGWNRSATGRTEDHSRAWLDFDNQSVPEIKLNLNFIERCLQISGADFMSHFGGANEFFPVGISGSAPAPPGFKFQHRHLSDPGDFQGPITTGYYQIAESSADRPPGIFLGFSFGWHPDGWPNKIVESVGLNQFP